MIKSGYELYGKTMQFEDLKDKVFDRVEQKEDEIHFYCTDGYLYVLEHIQDCCESVFIEDICGDLEDLVDMPILLAEATCEAGEPREEYSSTWTFYKLATIKGYVTIRFFGSSNGFYSESVDLIRYSKENVEKELYEA